MWHSIGASQPSKGQALETVSSSPVSFQLLTAPQPEESSWLPPVHVGLWPGFSLRGPVHAVHLL